MYAVIQSGGKQYRVTIGDRFKVESLKLDPGSKVDLEQVLLVADGEDVTVGSPVVDVPVQATVIGHGRGEKVRILKFRRRKNSRQRAGHRQNYTELEVISIGGNSAPPAATAKKTEASPEAEAAEPEKAAAPAEKTAKKTASKKKASKKATSKD